MKLQEAIDSLRPNDRIFVHTEKIRNLYKGSVELLRARGILETILNTCTDRNVLEITRNKNVVSIIVEHVMRKGGKR